jgi:hypothetical protein
MALPDLPWERLHAGDGTWRKPLHVVVKTRVTTGSTEEPKLYGLSNRRIPLSRAARAALDCPGGTGGDADGRPK